MPLPLRRICRVFERKFSSVQTPLGRPLEKTRYFTMPLGAVFLALASACLITSAHAEHPCVDAVCGKEYKPVGPFDRAVNKFQVELRKQCLASKQEVIELCKKLMATEGLSAEDAAKRAEEQIASRAPSQTPSTGGTRPATATAAPQPSKADRRYQIAYDNAYRPCAATCLKTLNDCLRQSQSDEQRGVCERAHEQCEADCRETAHSAASQTAQ